MSCSDFPASIALRFVSFARRYRSRGDDGISQVPGEPSQTRPGLRPRRDPRARPFRRQPYSSALGCCQSRFRRRWLPRLTPFGAQSHGSPARCLRFAATVTRAPRKTRYRVAGQPSRTGLQPAGLHCEVSAALFYMASSSPRLCLAHRKASQSSSRNRSSSEWTSGRWRVLRRGTAPPAPSSRRPPRGGRLSQNRTSAVHIRLFGTVGCNPRRRPVHDLAYPSPSVSWTGAMTCSCFFLHVSTSETSPRLAKYALRSPRSTADAWLSAQTDLRPV